MKKVDSKYLDHLEFDESCGENMKAFKNYIILQVDIFFWFWSKVCFCFISCCVSDSVSLSEKVNNDTRDYFKTTAQDYRYYSYLVSFSWSFYFVSSNHEKNQQDGDH